jgi:CPA2 family monovalent cation:H+ antiporter-2
MHGEFLLGAGIVLAALALGGVLFLRLKQSIIPAFIVLGVVMRPDHFDDGLVSSIATVGLVLLLFSMGLEFSLGALVRNRRGITRAGIIDLLACLPVGIAAGLVVGEGWAGALLFAGAFYVSSSAIIAKSIIELRRAADPETEVALGILVFEDLFIALYLAVLSGAVLVAEPSLLGAAAGVGKALLFFGVVVLIALRARSVLDRLFAIDSDDLFLLLVGALVLLLSWSALTAGLSEAIGAFLAGLALAETQHRERAERLFAPLQGVFAAIFFFGFGLSIDPGTFPSVWLPAVVLVILAVVVKVGGGWVAGRRSGLSQRGSLTLGLTLVARGEFSIILAGIAVSVGQARLGALLALLVLGLSLVGTAGLQYANQITRWVFPRRRERSLEERGFSPELAAADFPPRTEEPGS